MDPNNTSPLAPPNPAPLPTPPNSAPVKSGKSKHLILILLIIFPPLAWYYMWKEDKYHNWFASVLIVDGLIFLATSLLLLAAVYPPIMQIFTSLKVETPSTAKIVPYFFIAVGIIEILYGGYLRIKTHHLASLPKNLLIPVIILLSAHFIGLPLGQAASYIDLIKSLYNTQLNTYNSLPQIRQQITPQPTINSTIDWKAYENNKYSYKLKHPSNWKFIEANNAKDYDMYYEKLEEDELHKITITDETNAWTFFQLIVYNNKENHTLDEWTKERLEYKNTGERSTNPFNYINTQNVNNQQFKHYSQFEFDQEGGILVGLYGGKIYYFHYIEKGPNDPEFNKNKKIYADILTSFQFLDNAMIISSPPTSTISQIPNETTVCTRDTRVCPDGTTVSRTGPNCEFTVCPN